MKGIFGSSIQRVSNKTSSNNIHNTPTPGFNNTRSQAQQKEGGRGGGSSLKMRQNQDNSSGMGVDHGSNSVSNNIKNDSK